MGENNDPTKTSGALRKTIKTTPSISIRRRFLFAHTYFKSILGNNLSHRLKKLVFEVVELFFQQVL
jgi:hypothetical protein